jgi:hypothetical protein
VSSCLLTWPVSTLSSLANLASASSHEVRFDRIRWETGTSSAVPSCWTAL